MTYHKGCRNGCGCILTIEEMKEEKNPSGWCKSCQKKHAVEFHKQFDLKKEEEVNRNET